MYTTETIFFILVRNQLQFIKKSLGFFSSSFFLTFIALCYFFIDTAVFMWPAFAIALGVTYLVVYW